ncbi:HAD-superfamily hydrolase [Pelomyxa schiedti]|nr:HAD-superfamily hydrolase [Pelomyxa schiedti]
MRLRRARAALFDMDGTLLDTEPLSTLAINRVIEPFGHTCDPALKAKLLGKPKDVWSHLVIDELSLHGKLGAEELAEQWEANLCSMSAEELPGVDRLTAHLHAHRVPMAVCTGSSKVLVAAKKERHPLLMSRFSVVVTPECVKRGKPAPDMYLSAAEQVGVPPEECVVFEDAMSGVQSARAAGCVVVAIPAPDAKQEIVEAFKAAADVVLRSMEDFDPSWCGLPSY